MAKKIGEVVGVVIAAIGIGGALFLLGWLLTAGVFFLVCLCFSWAFSWLMSLGLWIVVLAATLWLSFTIYLSK